MFITALLYFCSGEVFEHIVLFISCVSLLFSKMLWKLLAPDARAKKDKQKLAKTTLTHTCKCIFICHRLQS